MSGYTKLFSDIIESSIWQEPLTVKIVWVTMLALADSEGFIRGSVGWLAMKSGVLIDECANALDRFKSPDPHSRTPDNEGRRIEETPDGWVILNYVYYRENNGKQLASDSRRTYQREWMRKKRESRSVNKCQQASTGVNECQPSASASASVSPIKDDDVMKTERDPHARVAPESLKDTSGARDFIKLHPAFSKIREMAIENFLTEYKSVREFWPEILRRFQTDFEGVEKTKYPPIKQLRYHFDDYLKANKLNTHVSL